MNYITFCSKYVFKNNSSILKNSFKIHTVTSNFRLVQNVNKKYLIHTSALAFAGHSKWANIKHVKGAKDLEKSKTFSRLSQQMRMAVKEGGGIDPKINSRLAKVIEQCHRINMPTSTIENSLKKYQKSAENSKPGYMALISPTNLTIAIDLFTDNLNRTRGEVKHIAKKLNFKEERGKLDHIFEEKGFVITKAKDINKAVDDAIEAGAEDVIEEDDMFTFVCDASDFYQVKGAIEKMNYDVEYAAIDKIPYSIVHVNEEISEKLKIIIEKLEEHEDIVKMYYNFEL